MNTFDLARAYERGACVECSRPGRVVFHGTDSSCPFRGRYHAVPCRGASLWESAHNRHMTRNNDRICNACRAKMPAAHELAAASRAGANDRGSSAATPVLSSGDAG